jgi:26S proteasome regulatory subunit N4
VLNCPSPAGAPGAGLTGSLVDSQGYPRADLDLYQVRQQRQRVNCLRNDHKALMKEIETLLHKLHAVQATQAHEEATNSQQQTSLSSTESGRAASATVLPPVVPPPLVPFARIENVLENSPAVESGLCKDDLILKFGDVDSTNSRGLLAVSSVVADNIGKAISVEVMRNGQRLDNPLSVTPKPWTGPGVLGCTFKPI